MTDEYADVSGQVALITGAARRVGRAIAQKLAAAGASVVINTRGDLSAAETLAHEIENTYGAGRAFVQLADVTDPVAVERMVDAIVQRYGRVDILVNNANARQQAETKTVTLEAWHVVLRTTLDGAFLCARAVIPFMERAGSGRIVNIAGISAHTGAKNHPHVMAAKAGLIGLTRALAIDYGPLGVTVNCISPALIVAQDDPPARVERLLKHFPLDHVPAARTGTPEEIADAVVSLCGPAWRFMTGQTIHFNGGVYFGGA